MAEPLARHSLEALTQLMLRQTELRAALALLPQNFQTIPRVLASSVRYSNAFGSLLWPVCPSSFSRRDRRRSLPMV